jgi:hypothetical protein
VVVTGGAVVVLSVVVVVGGTEDEQALKPTDSAMTAAKVTFFKKVMVGLSPSGKLRCTY